MWKIKKKKQKKSASLSTEGERSLRVLEWRNYLNLQTETIEGKNGRDNLTNKREQESTKKRAVRGHQLETASDNLQLKKKGGQIGWLGGISSGGGWEVI